MKVYIAIEDVDMVGDFSNDHGEDYNSSVIGVFANKDDAKEFITSLPEQLKTANDRHIIKEEIEHDGWLIKLMMQGDEMYSDLRLRYRIIEEEVQ
jgi:hypothetical protein